MQLDLKEFGGSNPLLAINLRQVFSALECHEPQGFPKEQLLPLIQDTAAKAHLRRRGSFLLL
jgi:hypothetical protein